MVSLLMVLTKAEFVNLMIIIDSRVTNRKEEKHLAKRVRSDP